MAAGDERPLTKEPLDERRRRLAKALDVEHGRRQESDADGRPRGSTSSYGVAFRLASEFVAAVLVGAAIGWGLDRFVGTSPWGLIAFLLLGFVAGVVNVMRESQRMSSAHTSRDIGQEQD